MPTFKDQIVCLLFSQNINDLKRLFPKTLFSKNKIQPIISFFSKRIFSYLHVELGRVRVERSFLLACLFFSDNMKAQLKV